MSLESLIDEPEEFLKESIRFTGFEGTSMTALVSISNAIAVSSLFSDEEIEF